MQQMIAEVIVKKFPSVYEIQKFITVLTKRRHWSLFR
jgi:hypothetical protein